MTFLRQIIGTCGGRTAGWFSDNASEAAFTLLTRPIPCPALTGGPTDHFREPKQTLMSSSKDQYKEKFRPDSDSALDRELSAALGDVSLEKLYGFDKPQEKQEPSTEQLAAKGLRKGRIVSIGKDDLFVDLGGKSQG